MEMGVPKIQIITIIGHFLGFSEKLSDFTIQMVSSFCYYEYSDFHKSFCCTFSTSELLSMIPVSQGPANFSKYGSQLRILILILQLWNEPEPPDV